MRLRESSIEDVVELLPERHADARGYFAEVYRDDWFRANVASVHFVQENQSLTRNVGTVRGLHYQAIPHAQGKLVTCLVGAIFDVAVDIRRGSPTYGKWASAILSAEVGNHFWMPAGFLHGFCSLAENTLVAYKVTAYYDRASEGGVRWNDPEIGIAWPDLADPALLSEKDRQQPRLLDLPGPFDYVRGK